MLDDARDAMERGDPARTLRVLLDVWRETRDPALADLIDRVSAHAEIPYDVVFPSSRRHHSYRWMQRAADPDPRELPALLQRTARVADFEKLARAGHDPRIARALVARIPHVYAVDAPAACVLLAQLRDSRGRAELQAAGPPWSEVRFDVHVVVPAEALAAIDAALARVRAAEEARERDKALRFARVYANPLDLAERAVLADWLMQHDDPRGELIALQLAPPTRERLRRAKQLVRAHGRAWSSDLRRALWGGGATFARGFVDACVVDVRKLHAVEQAPAWSLVRTVSLVHDGDRGRTFAPLLPQMASLEGISGMASPTFDALVAGARPTVRRIGLDFELLDPARRDEFRELAALPRLRRIAGRLSPSSWFIGGPAWQRLDVVGTSGDITRLGAWLGVMALPSSARIRKLVVWDADWTLQLLRPARLRILGPRPSRWRWDLERTEASLLAAVRSLPARSLDEVRVSAEIAGLADEVARVRR